LSKVFFVIFVASRKSSRNPAWHLECSNLTFRPGKSERSDLSFKSSLAQTITLDRHSG
jgi:hypothetical protein